MFVCTECTEHFCNNTEFMSHVHYCHKPLAVYRCGSVSCFKSFASYESFRKHMRIKHEHNSQSSNNNKNIISTPVTNHTDEILCLDANQAKSSNILIPEMQDAEYSNIIRTKIAETILNIDTCNIDEIEPMLIKHTANEIQSLVDNEDKRKLYVLFAAKLHNYPDITRKQSAQIINDVDKLIKNIIDNTEKDVLKEISSPSNNIKLEKIKEVFNNSRSLFRNIKTEWLCFRTFQQYNTYISPIEYILGERQEFVYEGNVQVMKMVKVTAQFIPMRFVFQKFFEIPGLFTEIIEYMNSLLCDNILISNFIQGTLWKKTVLKYNGKIVFPLFYILMIMKIIIR